MLNLNIQIKKIKILNSINLNMPGKKMTALSWS